MPLIGREEGLRAIDLLFQRRLSCSLSELYTLVYNISIQVGKEQDYSAILYEDYCKRVAQSVADLSQSLKDLLDCQTSGEPLGKENWLQSCVCELKSRARFAHVCMYGFSYLDRFYVKGNSKQARHALPTVRDVATKHFRQAGLDVLTARLRQVLIAEMCKEPSDDKESWSAEWHLVRDLAKAWLRLFGSLLGPNSPECDVFPMLQQHRLASLAHLASASGMSHSLRRVFGSQLLVDDILSFIGDPAEVFTAYGLKPPPAVPPIW
ncbi:unnamed protein product [Polarella glacialis]|uniref:Cullin N-terminal domain-containing protein n=1 Tax=Polarella glacialis TaxID=89957 RepID=A0A813LQE8_POLGL|nr:unnamed protein product [Polarella glacialis]